MNIEEAIRIIKSLKVDYNKEQGKGDLAEGIAEMIIDFDDIEAIETLLTAYEKEKEKNSKAIGHIEACKTSLGNYILSPNETEYLLSILKEE